MNKWWGLLAFASLLILGAAWYLGRPPQTGSADQPTDTIEHSDTVKESTRGSFDNSLRSSLSRASGGSNGKSQPQKSTLAAKPQKPQPPGVEGRERSIAKDILAMPDGDAKNLAFTELMRRWAEEDLESAWAFFDEVKDDVYMKRAFYKGVMGEVAKHDPELVLSTIENGQWWQDQWIPAKAATLAIAKTDLDRAVSYVSAAPVGKQQGDVAYYLANRLIDEKGRDAALTFAETLKKPAVRGFAVRAAVSDWILQDADGATQYVDGLKEPKIRDHAVLGLVDGIWRSNPTESVEWVGSIENPEMRTDTYIKLALNWQRRNQRQNVEAMLTSGTLSATEASAVRQSLAEK